MDYKGNIQKMHQFAQSQGEQPQQWAQGTYLDQGNFDPSNPNTSWEDFVRQLGFSNLANITNFQSPLYQQYASYLQNTQGGGCRC